MQSKDEFAESNTTKETGNGRRRYKANDNLYQFPENGTVQAFDQPAITSIKDDTPCKTNRQQQRDTVLKRIKKKILRKSGRNSSEDSKMASKENYSNGRLESFEEDDYFEGHIYEVPFANTSAQNPSGVARNMANSRCENDEYNQVHGRILQRNTLPNSSNSVARKKREIWCQNGSVKFVGGDCDRNVENSTNGSVNKRNERFLHNKCMSLPARSRGQVPLPGVAVVTPRLPNDTSSEDSSSDDWVEPQPKSNPDLRNLRSQSLPSSSKLNLNYQFLNGLNDLCKCSWYWGPLTSKEAEVKLHGKPDGTFLVRDSNDNRYLLSLSFRSAQKTLHTRIEFSKGQFSFYSAPFITTGSFASVIKLIDNCVETSKERVYCYTKGRALNGATFPVRLTKPLSRFEYVCSLQHLCRFVIRQHFTLETITDMPLPGIMKRYLGKNHFDAKPSE